jgi:hypothetical protein
MSADEGIILSTLPDSLTPFVASPTARIDPFAVHPSRPAIRDFGTLITIGPEQEQET